MTDLIHWNLKGIKDKHSSNFQEKVDIVSHMLSSPQNNLIVNLQETHLSEECQIPLDWENFEHLYTIIPNFCSRTDSFSGTLTFINKTLEIVVTEILIPGRLVLVKTKNDGANIVTNYISLYGKASGSNQEKRSILEKILEKGIDVHEISILIGDFNFVTSTLDRNSNKLNNVDEACKGLWSDIENSLNLIDCFRVTNKVRRLYTFTSPTSSKSRIDRIYISTAVSGNILSTSFQNTNVSDHKIVRTRFKQAVIKGPGSYIINKSLLYDNSFISGFRDIIYEFTSSIGSFQSHRILWDFLKMAISDYSKTFSIEKARERKTNYYNALKRIEIIEAIPKSCLNAGHINELNNNKKIEVDFLNYKRAGAMLR